MVPRNYVRRHGISHSRLSHILEHGSRWNSVVTFIGQVISSQIWTTCLIYYVIMYFIAAGVAILHYCPCLNAGGTLIQNIKTIIRKAVRTNNRKA